jgi:hypothetical protein
LAVVPPVAVVPPLVVLPPLVVVPPLTCVLVLLVLVTLVESVLELVEPVLELVESVLPELVLPAVEPPPLVPAAPSTASLRVTVASLSLLTVKPRSRLAPAASGAAPVAA